MRQCLRSLLMTIVGLLALGATAEAVLVEIDMDPGSPGVQTNLSPVLVNDIFTVDVLVSGLTSPPLAANEVPLQGFEFHLNYDSAVLDATSAVGGNILLAPTFTLPDLTTPGLVVFGDLSLGDPTSTAAAGILASITFNTVGPGFSLLDLNGILDPDNPLDNPNGVALTALDQVSIPIDTVNNGSVNFVPIPGAALLFGTGLMGLIGIARRKALRTKL